MNIDKAKKILRKVQALIDNLDDQGSASSLERDLLRSYLRDVYEAISIESDSVTESPIPAVEVSEPTDSTPPPVVEPVQSPEPAPKEEQQEEPAIQYEPIQKEPEPAHEVIPEQSAPEPETVPEPEPELVEEVAAMVTQAQEVVSGHSAALLALFEDRSGSDLADQLQARPISAIQDEMGINERVLTINELFGGNPDAFSQTVETLNGMDGFESAKRYLLDGPANEFDWADAERTEKALIFVQLVRRRYL